MMACYYDTFSEEAKRLFPETPQKSVRENQRQSVRQLRPVRPLRPLTPLPETTNANQRQSDPTDMINFGLTVLSGLVMWLGVFFIKRTKKQIEKDLPIRWLKFYTYVRIPLSILLLLIGTVIALPAAHAFFNATAPIILWGLWALVPLVLLLVFVFVGLHRCRLWGWRLNWVVLLCDSAFFSNFSNILIFVGGLLSAPDASISGQASADIRLVYQP